MKKLYKIIIISIILLIITKILIIIFNGNSEEVVSDFIYTIIILTLTVIFAKKYIKSRDLINLKIIPKQSITFIKKNRSATEKKIDTHIKEKYHSSFHEREKRRNKSILRKIKRIFQTSRFMPYRKKPLSPQRHRFYFKNHIIRKYHCR